MKGISLTITAFMLSVAVHSQTINVHKKSGEIVKFNVSEVNYMDFSDETEGEEIVGPVTPSTNTIDFHVKNTNIDDFFVFGYYTGTKNYDSSSLPNLFYNQQVTKVDGSWKYAPIKYWPTTDEGKSLSSFFAYAYGKPTTENIISLARRAESNLSTTPATVSKNTYAGDPYVEYGTDFNPESQIDLCWGVSNKNQLPMIDMENPVTGEQLDFVFKHALASLNIKMSLADNSGSMLSNGTRVWLRYVILEGVADKGALNLNASASEGPRWLDASNTDAPIGNRSVYLYDGRKDGKEAVAAAVNEKPAVLNKKLIQSLPYGSENMTPGVTTAEVNLFETDNSNAPVYVIPAGESFKVTVCYDVETPDENLSTFLGDSKTHGSSVENCFTKTFISNGLVAGKEYGIHLKLGLTSVSGSIEITDWDNGTAITR